jgi:hypothetical protein
MDVHAEAAAGRAVPDAGNLGSMVYVKAWLYGLALIEWMAYSLAGGFLFNLVFEGVAVACRNALSFHSGLTGLAMSAIAHWLWHRGLPAGTRVGLFFWTRPRFVRFLLSVAIGPVVCAYALKTAIVATQVYGGAPGSFEQLFGRELALHTFTTNRTSLRGVAFVEMFYNGENISQGVLLDRVHWQFGLQMYVLGWFMVPLIALGKWAARSADAVITARAEAEVARRARRAR